MGILKRALTYLVSQSGKTLSLLLLIFILGTLLIGALSVESAVTNTISNLRRRMPAVVTTYFDFNRFNASIDWNSVPDGVAPQMIREERLTIEQLRQLGELDSVSAYEYVIRHHFNSLDLRGYIPTVLGMEWEPYFDAFQLFGTSNTALAHEENNRIEIIAGRTFEEEELIKGQYGDASVAIISEALALENNLSIGSTFTISLIVNYFQDHFSPWERFLEGNIYTIVEMEVTVIGLFDLPDRIVNPQSEREENEVWEQRLQMNRIYVPNWVNEVLITEERSAFRRLAENEEDLHPHIQSMINRDIDVLSIFTLTDPLLFDEFRNAANEILPEFYSVVDMSGSFRDIAFSMANLQDIADWILYISIGSLLVILVLLLLLFLRDRRHEIGIYLALGEKKLKIIFQILIEVLTVTLVGITLAMLVGNGFSNTLSRWMLQEELAEAYEERSTFIAHDAGTVGLSDIGIPIAEMSPEEMLEAFDMMLSVETVSLFYLIGIGVVVSSTLISVVYVVRMNPKKILM